MAPFINWFGNWLVYHKLYTTIGSADSAHILNVRRLVTYLVSNLAFVLLYFVDTQEPNLSDLSNLFGHKLSDTITTTFVLLLFSQNKLRAILQQCIQIHVRRFRRGSIFVLHAQWSHVLSKAALRLDIQVSLGLILIWSVIIFVCYDNSLIDYVIL